MDGRARIGLGLVVSTLTLHCGGSASTGAGGPGNADGGDASSVACGTRAGMRGKTSRTLTVDGTKRTYIAYLPSSASAATPAPLVFVFHGAEMNAADMFDLTGYPAIADSDGVAVVFLDGQNTNSATGAMTLSPWNVSDNGAPVCGDGDLANNTTPDVDFAFMDAVKADIAQDQCIDAAHVYGSGFSMGGYFSHHVGCDRTDIRAVAPHSGGTIASLSSCKTGHVPVIIFHGGADPLINDGCDDPTVAALSGFPASATLWAKKNGCGTTYTTTTEDGMGGGDGQCFVYEGCPADGQVELCVFAGMMHCYAGGSSDSSVSTFSCPTYASATDLQWSFFKKYAW
jgi:poly(3-hydroxybutyrate) depolymerase